MKFQDMCTHNAVTTIPAALSAAASMLLAMICKLLSVSDRRRLIHKVCRCRTRQRLAKLNLLLQFRYKSDENIVQLALIIGMVVFCSDTNR